MRHAATNAILGIALLSVMDAIIKGLVQRLPVLEIALVRYVVGSLVMLAVLVTAWPGMPSAGSIRANALRAVLVVLTATTFFYALGQLPLAEVLILSFVSPVATALLAALVLGEPLDGRILAALGVGFAGMVVIVAPGLGAGGWAGSLPGVAAVIVSAFGYSASNVLLRARARHDPLVTILSFQNILPAAMLAGPAAAVWSPPVGYDWLLLVAIGALGVGGHVLLARAYARAEASRLAPLDYTALVWAVVIGFFVFDEVPAGFTMLGAVLISAAAWLASRPARPDDRRREGG